MGETVTIGQLVLLGIGFVVLCVAVREDVDPRKRENTQLIGWTIITAVVLAMLVGRCLQVSP